MNLPFFKPSDDAKTSEGDSATCLDHGGSDDSTEEADGEVDPEDGEMVGHAKVSNNGTDFKHTDEAMVTPTWPGSLVPGEAMVEPSPMEKTVDLTGGKHTDDKKQAIDVTSQLTKLMGRVSPKGVVDEGKCFYVFKSNNLKAGLGLFSVKPLKSGQKVPIVGQLHFAQCPVFSKCRVEQDSVGRPKSKCPTNHLRHVQEWRWLFCQTQPRGIMCQDMAQTRYILVRTSQVDLAASKSDGCKQKSFSELVKEFQGKRLIVVEESVMTAPLTDESSTEASPRRPRRVLAGKRRPIPVAVPKSKKQKAELIQDDTDTDVAETTLAPPTRVSANPTRCSSSSSSTSSSSSGASSNRGDELELLQAQMQAMQQTQVLMLARLEALQPAVQAERLPVVQVSGQNWPSINGFPPMLMQSAGDLQAGAFRQFTMPSQMATYAAQMAATYTGTNGGGPFIFQFFSR